MMLSFTMMGIAGETRHHVGERRPVEDVAIAAAILATGRPAQREYDTAMLDPLGAVLREHAIGVPILVGGSLAGVPDVNRTSSSCNFAGRYHWQHTAL